MFLELLSISFHKKIINKEKKEVISHPWFQTLIDFYWYSFGKKLYYYQAIHQESDVVPENIDAIRAMCNLESDSMKSVEKTNKALGIN